MKTEFSNVVRVCWVLGLASWASGTKLTAQTPAGLDIRTYAGLTITGTVATVYSIDYVTDLAQTNDASAWRCLEYLQLPASPARIPIIFSDSNRIYRDSFAQPVTDSDIVEAAETAHDRLRSGQLAGVSVECPAESREDDIGRGDA